MFEDLGTDARGKAAPSVMHVRIGTRELAVSIIVFGAVLLSGVAHSESCDLDYRRHTYVACEAGECSAKFIAIMDLAPGRYCVGSRRVESVSEGEALWVLRELHWIADKVEGETLNGVYRASYLVAEDIVTELEAADGVHSTEIWNHSDLTRSEESFQSQRVGDLSALASIRANWEETAIREMRAVKNSLLLEIAGVGFCLVVLLWSAVTYRRELFGQAPSRDQAIQIAIVILIQITLLWYAAVFPDGTMSWTAALLFWSVFTVMLFEVLLFLRWLRQKKVSPDNREAS